MSRLAARAALALMAAGACGALRVQEYVYVDLEEKAP